MITIQGENEEVCDLFIHLPARFEDSLISPSRVSKTSRLLYPNLVLSRLILAPHLAERLRDTLVLSLRCGLLLLDTVPMS